MFPTHTPVDEVKVAAQHAPVMVFVYKTSCPYCVEACAAWSAAREQAPEYKWYGIDCARASDIQQRMKVATVPCLALWARFDATVFFWSVTDRSAAAMVRFARKPCARLYVEETCSSGDVERGPWQAVEAAAHTCIDRHATGTVPRVAVMDHGGRRTLEAADLRDAQQLVKQVGGEDPMARVNADAARAGRALVFFFQPWCGHCTAMKPAWSEVEAAKGLCAHAIDCTKHAAVPTEHGVMHFPLLRLYLRDGAPREYDGPRTSEAILAWART